MAIQDFRDGQPEIRKVRAEAFERHRRRRWVVCERLGTAPPGGKFMCFHAPGEVVMLVHIERHCHLENACPPGRVVRCYDEAGSAARECSAEFQVPTQCQVGNDTGKVAKPSPPCSAVAHRPVPYKIRDIECVHVYGPARRS